MVSCETWRTEPQTKEGFAKAPAEKNSVGGANDRLCTTSILPVFILGNGVRIPSLFGCLNICAGEEKMPPQLSVFRKEMGGGIYLFAWVVWVELSGHAPRPMPQTIQSARKAKKESKKRKWSQHGAMPFSGCSRKFSLKLKLQNVTFAQL